MAVDGTPSHSLLVASYDEGKKVKQVIKNRRCEEESALKSALDCTCMIVA